MQLNINQVVYEFKTEDKGVPLLWFLRDYVGLTGTKYGCGIGVCGACTVLIDGEPIPSCLLPIEKLSENEITTIEGLSVSSYHPVQQAWKEVQVPQCGYCQSGQILTAVSLLNKVKRPDDDAIKEAMSGVLCRCGTYPRIIEAIKLASRKMEM